MEKDKKQVEETQEIEQCEQCKEYLDQLQRLQAEFDNFTKRTQKEKQELLKNANEDLITELLRVLDSFELALKHNNDKGIKMVYSELYSILEKEGLKPIEAIGEYNPELHEALMQEEGEENKIVEELQKGYKLNDKVIRASKVKITKEKK